MDKISFEFEGQRYEADETFYETNEFRLPDGRVIAASGWLETSPPRPSGLMVKGPGPMNAAPMARAGKTIVMRGTVYGLSKGEMTHNYNSTYDAALAAHVEGSGVSLRNVRIEHLPEEEATAIGKVFAKPRAVRITIEIED